VGVRWVQGSVGAQAGDGDVSQEVPPVSGMDEDPVLYADVADQGSGNGPAAGPVDSLVMSVPLGDVLDAADLDAADGLLGTGQAHRFTSPGRPLLVS
jgi:hypothetical protein